MSVRNEFEANEIPLVVGVAGHRHLAPESVTELEERVRRFFRELRKRWKHTPIEVLCALAEGSDRLVARVALAMKIDIIAPLPMPADEYCRDFCDDASRDEFAEMQARAKRSYVVTSANTNRPACYENVGQHIAQRCHILLALWDGQPAKGVGGTAHVVRMKLEGVRIAGAQCALNIADTGPVHHIVAARGGETAESTDRTSDLWPANHGKPEDARKFFERIWQQIDDFNRDVGKLSAEAPRSSEMASVTDEALLLFKAADALAIRFSSRTKSALVVLLIVVFMAVFALEFFHHVCHDWRVLLLYLLLLGAAFVAYRIAIRNRYHEKFLDYRALAEGLRVQYYWRIAGLEEAAADHYMRHQRDELHWIRTAMRRFESPPAHITESPELARFDFVFREWVEGQDKYFRKTVTAQHRRLEILEQRIRWLIGLGVAVALFFLLTLPYVHFVHEDPWKPVIVLAMGIPAVLAACLHTFKEKNALPSHVKRYARARTIYDHARKQLRAAIDARDWTCARKILRELGELSLQENGEWVILHRERPLEVPYPA